MRLEFGPHGISYCSLSLPLPRMLDPALAEKRAQESLVGFPASIHEAYRAFAATGDLRSLDTVVLGVLHFYMARKPAGTLDALPGTTKLADDLGCDSLTMMDTVFMVESLFDIKIDDAELVQIVTLDDLRAKLRQHVQTPPAPIS